MRRPAAPHDVAPASAPCRAPALPLTRRVLLSAGALATCGALAGCGFQLRRRQPLAIERIALVGFGRGSTLEAELRREILASGATRIVETPNEAQAVLRVLRDNRDRVVVTTTGAGLVREISLRQWFTFRVTSADPDEVWLPDTALLQARDMAFNERDALAKQSEAELLYRAMQTELVQQVMRRLAALTPRPLGVPQPLAPASASASASASR